jgi:hypothetical protein
MTGRPTMHSDRYQAFMVRFSPEGHDGEYAVYCHDIDAEPRGEPTFRGSFPSLEWARTLIPAGMLLVPCQIGGQPDIVEVSV